MFARIARRYDRLNKIMSLGRDQAWRRAAIGHLPPGRVLDLGAGTGAAADVLGDRQVVALDPEPNMLGLNPADRRVVAVGEALPFRDASFDGVFSAFVFRNLTSVADTLDEMARVMRPGAVAAVVDLSRPTGSAAARIHRAATKALVPSLGATIGARQEYSYLNESLDKLPPPQALFGGGPLRLDKVWRMGPMGFVYGVVLRKS